MDTQRINGSHTAELPFQLKVLPGGSRSLWTATSLTSTQPRKVTRKKPSPAGTMLVVEECNYPADKHPVKESGSFSQATNMRTSIPHKSIPDQPPGPHNALPEPSNQDHIFFLRNMLRHLPIHYNHAVSASSYQPRVAI